MDLYRGEGAFHRNTETPTIVLYEQDHTYRQEIVNYFAEKGGFRVLALEYLVQTDKQCNVLRPEAIICNPDGHITETLDVIRIVKANLNIAGIPFYLMSSLLSDAQKHIFIKAGVRNIFERDFRMDVLYKGVLSKKGMEEFRQFDFNKPVELVAHERLLPNQENCFYVLMQSIHQSDLIRLFAELFKKPVSLTWNWVTLEISCLEDLQADALKLIIEYKKRCQMKGIHLVLITASDQLKQLGLKFNIPVFKNYTTYEAQFKNSATTNISAMESLDDLLSQIPD